MIEVLFIQREKAGMSEQKVEGREKKMYNATIYIKTSSG